MHIPTPDELKQNHPWFALVGGALVGVIGAEAFRTWASSKVAGAASRAFVMAERGDEALVAVLMEQLDTTEKKVIEKWLLSLGGPNNESSKRKEDFILSVAEILVINEDGPIPDPVKRIEAAVSYLKELAHMPDDNTRTRSATARKFMRPREEDYLRLDFQFWLNKYLAMSPTEADTLRASIAADRALIVQQRERIRQPMSFWDSLSFFSLTGRPIAVAFASGTPTAATAPAPTTTPTLAPSRRSRVKSWFTNNKNEILAYAILMAIALVAGVIIYALVQAIQSVR